MKFVVAVSGGVDSVVLLDMFVRRHGARAVVVAHFDHGIRHASTEDARFVEMLARRYGCDSAIERKELGTNASEAAARKYRYEFLYAVARKYGGALVVAHHLDDLVETVALSIMRGTGWRGLTPFGQSIERPLLGYTKQEIIAYAEEHGLEWHEDETNESMRYARNRIRSDVQLLPLDMKRQILALYARQWEIRRYVEQTIADSVRSEHARYFFIMLPDVVRYEYVRHITQARLTGPQIRRLALAICTARPKTVYEAGAGVNVRFTTRTFTVELIK